MSSLSDFDLYLLAEGTHHRSFDKLGAHVVEQDGRPGTRFAVWAPNAASVAIIGDFNGWDDRATQMVRSGWGGFWERFVPGVGPGALYKYLITPDGGGPPIAKGDPYAFAAEAPPGNASRVWDPNGYEWGDADWMAHRAGVNAPGAPISIYEVHLGSWRRVPEQGDRPMGFREAAGPLADYAAEMGFTHVELLPVAEHPFAGSWGYQITQYFAPSSRFGTPQDLMYLVDTLHRRGVGVILDWVPAHFPDDEHGLSRFDGTPLYEHADPRLGQNPEWDTLVFDFGKPQVRNFLVSNALYWLDRYHVDGLRVDAVSAMIRLDYAKGPGEWAPNRLGGRENLEALEFLRRFNEVVHREHPGVLTIAEETSNHPGLTRPLDAGGIGFDLRWDVGWVHDTVNEFLKRPPSERPGAYRKLRLRETYADDEKWVLPLSHDEVKKGQGALLAKMPGDDWLKRANLRLLLGLQATLPGKKLLFMGGEFGQAREWDHDVSLDWHLLDDPRHAGIRRWVRDLNTIYRAVPALHEGDGLPDGFRWVEADDPERLVLAFLRRAAHSDDLVLVACNLGELPLANARLGVPRGGHWEEILNGDAALYGGSGRGNIGGVDAMPIPSQGHPRSLNVLLPPLAVVAFRARA
jgi:1,4-alpha-glucan branching enzyme